MIFSMGIVWYMRMRGAYAGRNVRFFRVPDILLRERGAEHGMRDFWPGGSDARQYCSPGFDLPVGVLCRAGFGEYPGYHTSDDDKRPVSFTVMAEAVELCRDVVQALEANRVYVRTNPHREPFLSRYDLHDTIGAGRSKGVAKKTLQWLLNFADGRHDLVSKAERSGLHLSEFRIQAQRAEQAEEAGLINSAEVL
jgi:aminopeptidase-like protein